MRAIRMRSYLVGLDQVGETDKKPIITRVDSRDSQTSNISI